jgi:hypothetical protein
MSRTSPKRVVVVPIAALFMCLWAAPAFALPIPGHDVTPVAVWAGHGRVSWAVDTFTLNYTAGPNGTISGAASQTVDAGGNGTTVTAVASVGYHFVNWSDGFTKAARTDIGVDANLNVTAYFAINTYTLVYAAGMNGAISGAASQSVDYGGNGTTVTALPNLGYHFVSWSDGFTKATRTDSAWTPTSTSPRTLRETLRDPRRSC